MSLILDGTNGETFPTWTTATRPASPNTNQLGYNSTYGGYELWNGSAWSTISGGPAFSYYASSNQTLSTGVWTKVTFDTKEFDTNNNFASSKFTPTVAGYYQINASVLFNAGSQQDAIAVYKNGSFYKIGTYHPDPGTIGLREIIAALVYCNGSTDYIEIYALYNAGAATNTISGGQYNIWFQASLVRGA